MTVMPRAARRLLLAAALAILVGLSLVLATQRADAHGTSCNAGFTCHTGMHDNWNIVACTVTDANRTWNLRETNSSTGAIWDSPLFTCNPAGYYYITNKWPAAGITASTTLTQSCWIYGCTFSYNHSN